jgi:type VI secretion system secreted protein VgrG
MFIGKMPPMGQRVGILPVDPQDADGPYPPAGLLGAPPTPPPRERLGDLSMKYETGYGPGKEARAAARVSTGKGDKGGVSYGAYQLASKMDQPRQFLRQDGAQWADRFKGLDPTERGGAFGKIWKTIAAENPQAFFEAQHAYIQRTHYDPVVADVLQRTGVDIKGLPKAMQDAAWSVAVNHSGKGAGRILADGINNAKILAHPGTPDFNIAALDLMYDRRSGFVKTLDDPPQNLPGLLKRYGFERKDARAMLERQK